MRAGWGCSPPGRTRPTPSSAPGTNPTEQGCCNPQPHSPGSHTGQLWGCQIAGQRGWGLSSTCWLRSAPCEQHWVLPPQRFPVVLRFPLQPLQKPGLNRCQRERGGGEELCPLLPAPESFVHPPESPPTSKTPQRGPVGSYPPVPQPPWYKRGPEDPASPPGSHLRAMPLTTPTHRSTAIPEPPGPAAGGTRPEMPGGSGRWRPPRGQPTSGPCQPAPSTAGLGSLGLGF